MASPIYRDRSRRTTRRDDHDGAAPLNFADLRQLRLLERSPDLHVTQIRVGNVCHEFLVAIGAQRVR